MSDNRFRCAVNADLFRRAMAAVSTEETRYYLMGVNVTPAPQGGALLVSTDGHWLICIHDPRGIVEGSGIVSLNRQLTRELKSSRADVLGPHGSRTERLVIAGHDGDVKSAKAMVAYSGLAFVDKATETEVEPRADALALLDAPGRDVLAIQFRDAMIDGTYPDWRRVVPDDIDFGAITPLLDQRYVSKAADALLSGTIAAHRGVRFGSSGDPAGPVLVVSAGGPAATWDAFAVIMPMREGGAAPRVPTFWRAEPDQTRKAA